MNTWPVELTLDNCIKCTICVTACPVAAVTDRFPGPKYEGPQAARFRHAGQPTPDHSVDYCSGCRVCNMVCPTGVRIAEINARARASMVAQGALSWRTRLRNNVLARPETLGRWGYRVAPLLNALLHSTWARAAAHVLLGIDRRAPLPTLVREPFTMWFHGRPTPRGAKRRVIYFHGCSTQYYEPRVGRAAVRLLEAHGFEVIVPPQTCCGLPLLSNGEFEAARALYRDNVRRLVGYARQGYPIVGTSTSCTLTLKEEAPELLDIHDDDARLLAERTFDLSEFLVSLAEEGESTPVDLQPVARRALYHAPCQYRAHRLGAPSLELLRRIPELDLVESRADCCGIAGTYGFKREKYDIAMRVGRPLFDQVRESGVSVVICDSETCRWQLAHATGVPAVHPVELLAKAYGV
ncbi:MAG: anaerobic glycerol-3-phosphate dehydrogenase subunit C [Ardenticatenia bacterium]|nr:anaerobic glycerol-3-phosphate dehydrogenase subunit C [Ardenticatenia bacterium]